VRWNGELVVKQNGKVGWVGSLGIDVVGVRIEKQ
jgi:hypothetical protein